MNKGFLFFSCGDWITKGWVSGPRSSLVSEAAAFKLRHTGSRLPVLSPTQTVPSLELLMSEPSSALIPIPGPISGSSSMALLAHHSATLNKTGALERGSFSLTSWSHSRSPFLRKTSVWGLWPRTPTRSRLCSADSTYFCSPAKMHAWKNQLWLFPHTWGLVVPLIVHI